MLRKVIWFIIISLALSLGIFTGHEIRAHASTTAAKNSVMCRKDQHITVGNPIRKRQFIVRNDVFGNDTECLSNSRLWSNFRVVKSTANATSVDSVAFPEIFYGCAWGLCSPDTRLPEKVSKAMSLKTTWETRQKAEGKWNVAFDIWFMRHYHKDGQAKGAEVMIWLNSQGFNVSTLPEVRIDGVLWHFANHEACKTTGHTGCWHYVLFHRAKPVTGVKDLKLGPFFRFAEQKHLISRNWYVSSFDAGFEIWHGGKGLATTWFRVFQ